MDRIAGGGFRSTSETAEWAREIERNARSLRKALSAGFDRASSSQIAEEAERAVSELLGDREPGAVERTLRRPWTQLQPGMVARRALTRRVQRAATLVNEAIEIQPVIAELLPGIQALRARFETDFPTLCAEHMRRARLTESFVRSLRKPEAGRLAQHRLERVAEILEGYRAELPTDGVEQAIALDHAATHVDLTLRELRAALGFAVRTRRMAESSLNADRRMRQLSVELAEQLRRSAESTVQDNLAAEIVGQLALLSKDVRSAAFRGGQDVGLWTGIAAAGHNAAFPREGRFGCTLSKATELGDDSPRSAQVPDVPPSEELFVIPVIGNYVYISRSEHSAIRVWSRAINIGVDAECVLSPISSSIDASELALNDIPVLFDGFDADTSRWYETERRATVTILYRDGEQWFGRVGRKGQLHATDQLPDIEHGNAGAVRVLLRSRPRIRSSNDPAGKRRGAGGGVRSIGACSPFLGVENRWVRTPFADHQKAILRIATSGRVRETDAILRERSFFQACSSAGSNAEQPDSSTSGLILLTETTVVGGTKVWPLYAAPFGLTTHEAPPVARWLRNTHECRMGALQSAARLLVSVNTLGYSLGICHEACFSYSARWPDLNRAPLPKLGIFRAPAATKLGEHYPLLPNTEVTDRYGFLGIDPVLPAVRSQEVADAASDAAAFAAFMLDLIARDRLPADGSVSWANLADFVSGSARSGFLYPYLAAAIAERLGSANGRQSLWKLVVCIANADRVDPTELLTMC